MFRNNFLLLVFTTLPIFSLAEITNNPTLSSDTRATKQILLEQISILRRRTVRKHRTIKTTAAANDRLYLQETFKKKKLNYRKIRHHLTKIVRKAVKSRGHRRTIERLAKKYVKLLKEKNCLIVDEISLSALYFRDVFSDIYEKYEKRMIILLQREFPSFVEQKFPFLDIAIIQLYESIHANTTIITACKALIKELK